MASVLKDVSCHQLIESQDAGGRGALTPQPTRGSKQRSSTPGPCTGGQEWWGAGVLLGEQTLISRQPCLPVQPEQHNHCRILLETKGSAARNLKTMGHIPSLHFTYDGETEAQSGRSFPDKSAVQRARPGVPPFHPSTARPLLLSHTPPRPHPVRAVGVRPQKVTLPPKMPLGLYQSPPPSTPGSPWSSCGLGKARSPFIKTHKCPVVFFFLGQRISTRETVVKSWTGCKSGA